MSPEVKRAAEYIAYEMDTSEGSPYGLFFTAQTAVKALLEDPDLEPKELNVRVTAYLIGCLQTLAELSQFDGPSTFMMIDRTILSAFSENI